MRSVITCLLLSLALSVLPVHAAQTKTLTLSSRHCSIGTGYNVLADSGGIWLYRSEGMPREIFFHDGELSIDQELQVLEPADREHFRAIEAGTRAMMPEAAALARGVADVSFDAVASTFEILSGSRRTARRIEGLHRDALAHIDASLGKGRWDQQLFGDEFKARIEQAAESASGSVVRSVLWAALTGGRAMERRAERVEADLEQRMEARGKALESQADRLCTHVVALHALQQQLAFRYQGEPLRMLDLQAAPTQAEDADASGTGSDLQARAD